MYYLYLIKSKTKEFLYIGRTSNLNKRLNEHNDGKNVSTRDAVPYELIYYESYKNEKDAIDREIKLKHHGSTIGHLKKRLKNSLI